MKKRILVVDDDPSILEAIKLTLEDDGFIVETRERGDELYKLANGDRPDVIILDVLLSGMDGRDIARKLKSQKRTKEIPIIMISAHPSAAATVYKSGADDFISKPFDIDNLLGIVKKYAF